MVVYEHPCPEPPRNVYIVLCFLVYKTYKVHVRIHLQFQDGVHGIPSPPPLFKYPGIPQLPRQSRDGTPAVQ